MAESKMNATPDRVVERNIALTGQFTRYLLENPAIFSALPDAFELVIFPQNDPELQLYNLRLWEKSDAKESLSCWPIWAVPVSS